DLGRHRSSGRCRSPTTFENRQGAQLSFQMPLQLCCNQSTSRPPCRRVSGFRRFPVVVQQRVEQLENREARVHSTRHTTTLAQTTACLHTERRVFPVFTTSGTFPQRRCPTGIRHRPQQESVQYERRFTISLGQRTKRPHHQ